jgi:UV DNA damage repair endonuclease
MADISFSLFDLIRQNHSAKYQISFDRLSSSIVSLVTSFINTANKPTTNWRTTKIKIEIEMKNKKINNNNRKEKWRMRFGFRDLNWEIIEFN